ncbi:MAG: hypothetical protein GSR80_001205 [Desulfurococcales archaeon]|nr:hypothetical protein [Desulfurococcales archaeon]
MEKLLDKAEILSRLPAGIVKPRDPAYDTVEVRVGRALFSLHDVFRVRVEKEGNDTIMYIMESSRSKIKIRFLVEEAGVTVSKLYVGVESEGINVARIASRISSILIEWIDSVRIYIEEEARRARPRAVAPARRSPAPRRPAQPTAPQAREEPVATVSSAGPSRASPPKPASEAQLSPEEIAEGSRRLSDPLFEAEVLVKGRVVLADRMLLTKVADVIDRLGALEEFDPSKTYLVKITTSKAEASILIEGGRIRGALLSEGDRRVEGLEALAAIQRMLPGEAFITVISLG